MASARFGGWTALGLTAQHGGEIIRGQHGVGLGMLTDAFVRAAVVVELGAGAGGSFKAGRPPPVVAVAVAVDALGRDADVVVPDVVGLVVVQVDGDVHSLRRQAEQPGAEVPGEGNGVLLEVVADAEVA